MVQFRNFDSRERRQRICILAVLGPECCGLEEEFSAWSMWMISVTLWEMEGLTKPPASRPSRAFPISFTWAAYLIDLFHGEMVDATKLPGKAYLGNGHRNCNSSLFKRRESFSIRLGAFPVTYPGYSIFPMSKIRLEWSVSLQRRKGLNTTFKYPLTVWRSVTELIPFICFERNMPMVLF